MTNKQLTRIAVRKKKKERDSFWKKSTDYETFRPQKMVIPESVFQAKVDKNNDDESSTSSAKDETETVLTTTATTATTAVPKIKTKTKPPPKEPFEPSDYKPTSVKDMEELQVTLLGTTRQPGKFVMTTKKAVTVPHYQTFDVIREKKDVRELTVLTPETLQQNYPTYGKTGGSKVFKSIIDKSDIKTVKRPSVQQPAEGYEMLYAEPRRRQEQEPKPHLQNLEEIFGKKSSRKSIREDNDQLMSAKSIRRSKLSSDIDKKDKVPNLQNFDTVSAVSKVESRKGVHSGSASLCAKSLAAKKEKKEEKQKKRKLCIILSVIGVFVLLFVAGGIVIIIFVVKKSIN